MVVTFDSDPYQDIRHVVKKSWSMVHVIVFSYTQTTSSIHNTCDHGFSGTSASTPLVSGVIALLLEAK